MWINAEGSGTAGSFYYHLEITNLAASSCSLSGYPGVSAVGLGGGQLGSAARREAFGTVPSVTLTSAATTTALVRVTDVGALARACHPVLAAGFRVYPPGNRASKVVPFPFRTCANPAYRSIAVRAVRNESF